MEIGLAVILFFVVLFLVVLLSVVLPFAVLFAVLYGIRTVKKRQYEKTEYYQQTQKNYADVLLDEGLLGEFYTYQYLQPLDGYGRYLFNVYVPKDNGETTELDVVLLHESGIYVFESKNFSGWIFGSESQQNWTQTLPARKGHSHHYQFFNPIMQNEGHIKWLRAFLAEWNLPVYSYIVFSDRCALKDVTLTSGRHYVVNRYDLLPSVQENAARAGVQLSPDRIDALYDKLYPLTQIDDVQKMIHIRNVNEPVCPYCGGKLVMRTATRGNHRGENFWGCSRYPRCKYTKNISDKWRMLDSSMPTEDRAENHPLF